MRHPGIAILDFGSQYTQKIAQGVRRHGAYSEIFDPIAVPLAQLANATGIVLSGGPANISETASLRCDDAIFDLGVPILAVCYGFQYVAHRFGGRVERRPVGEYGHARFFAHADTGLLAGLAGEQQVWMSHGDTVAELPAGFETLGSTADCRYAAAWDPARRIYGVQFHPEVDHTQNGAAMLGNFVAACGTGAYRWSIDTHYQDALDEIRSTVGARPVVHLTSGGGDSTVAAIMLMNALPQSQLRFVYMDPGIMRKGETDHVRAIVARLGIPLTVLDTSEALIAELVGTIDPERKREAIGTHFVNQAARYADADLGSDWVLGQGTIYPDHIESQGTAHSARIKTHHNRVEAVRRLMEAGRVTEPILYLFKDELRELARHLAQDPRYATLGSVFAKRHPFPGPGLAIRLLCSDGVFEDDLAPIDAVANEHIAGSGYRATALPVRSVGVQGDERTFAHPLLLTGPRDLPRLRDMATDLTNRLRSRVNRVVYRWTPGDPGTPRLHPAYVTRERLDLLREADAVVMGMLAASGTMDQIAQCPTIAIPVGFDGDARDALVIRPFQSNDFMTGTAFALPHEVTDHIAASARGYSALLYDVTNKPPSTTEWE